LGPPRPLLPMLLIAALGVVVAATVIGLIALWPSGEGRPVPERSVRVRTEPARVTGLAEIPCRVGQRVCTRVTVELLEGEDKGRRVSFTTERRAPRSSSTSEIGSASTRTSSRPTP
jgi:hypothetical protein